MKYVEGKITAVMETERGASTSEVQSAAERPDVNQQYYQGIFTMFDMAAFLDLAGFLPVFSYGSVRVVSASLLIHG